MNDTLASLYATALEEALKDSETANRMIIADRLNMNIESLMQRKQCVNDSLLNEYRMLTNMLLDIDDEYITINDIFPDYQPKETPDRVSDYSWNAGQIVAQLPEATLDNLPELMRLYENWHEKADNHPGKWVDGNMLLGARPDEYEATDEELVLGELAPSSCLSLIRMIQRSLNKH
jgi:hypothetical protein